MSALKGLTDFLDREYAKNPELIDGSDPHEVAKVVDLSIAYTPVVHHRHREGDIPKPDKVTKDGLRYCLTWPEQKNWEWVTVEALKVMRARYLLLRGFFYRTLGGFSYPEQQKIIAWYFEGGVWRPKPESDLGKAMDLI